MTETVTIDRPSKAAVARPRSAKPVTVSASAPALHLDCSRTYIGKLEASDFESFTELVRMPVDRSQSPRDEIYTAAAMADSSAGHSRAAILSEPTRSNSASAAASRARTIASDGRPRMAE
jgi:hypothetical protein